MNAGQAPSAKPMDDERWEAGPIEMPIAMAAAKEPIRMAAGTIGTAGEE